MGLDGAAKQPFRDFVAEYLPLAPYVFETAPAASL